MARKASSLDEEAYERLRAETDRPGDCVVAATALEEDEPVVTRNVEDFERVPDVRVREY